ncbi:hypothetical protein GW17_00027647 [Ensete ventricosum]|nr:hypothetical protein GW17_00027647 [Ensete ventricosum]
MSSFPVPQASSSEGDPQLMIDERNRKRMLSNRESARRAQVSELTERLRSVNSVLHFFEGVSGMTIDTPKVPDPLLKPLQFPSAAQPIIANDDIFQLVCDMMCALAITLPLSKCCISYLKCLA